MYKILKIILFIILVGFIMKNNAYCSQKEEKATFAGGCFWCMETPFEALDGVKEVISGYTGGEGENPTYEDYGKKGYLESVEITYDPSKISYQDLLDVFWRQIDPTDSGGQFVDRGSHYRAAIFYHDENQKKLAENSKKKLEESGKFPKPIVTEIVKASKFYRAENYHQNFCKTNPARYKIYRANSGRDQFLKKVWGNSERKNNNNKHVKPKDGELRKKLTPLQYQVTQQCGTEKPFDNEYWDNKKEGIYVDVVSGEVLFSSLDKFDSGTGWPSFTKPLEPENVMEKEDQGFLGKRTEVRSVQGDSHLGHVFNDGPGPAGLRYCVNSASLRFVPKEDLDKEGYSKYKNLFNK